MNFLKVKFKKSMDKIKKKKSKKMLLKIINKLNY